MITDTFTINVHARVVVYMYLIFVMTGQWRQMRAFASVRSSLNLERLSGMHQC